MRRYRYIRQRRRLNMLPPRANDGLLAPCHCCTPYGLLAGGVSVGEFPTHPTTDLTPLTQQK